MLNCLLKNNWRKKDDPKIRSPSQEMSDVMIECEQRSPNSSVGRNVF